MNTVPIVSEFEFGISNFNGYWYWDEAKEGYCYRSNEMKEQPGHEHDTIQDPAAPCRNDGGVSHDMSAARERRDALGRRVQSLMDSKRAKEQEGRRVVSEAQAVMDKAEAEAARLRREAEECRLLAEEIVAEMNQGYPVPIDTH